MGLSLVESADRSPLGDFLVVWGSQLFLVVSLLLFWIARDWPWARLVHAVQRVGLPAALDRVRRLSARSLGLWTLALLGIVLAVVLGGALAALQMGVVALLCVLLLGAGVSLLRTLRGRSLLPRVLVFVGLALLLGIEFIYVRDFLAGGEWRRMNTVFKFFTQAWVLFGLAIGGVLPIRWIDWADAVLAGTVGLEPCSGRPST